MILKLHAHAWIFSSPVNSVSWWQEAFEWGTVYCSRIFIVRKITEQQCSCTFLALDSDFLTKNQTPVVCHVPTLLISGDIAKKVWIKCDSPVVPLISLQWKSNEALNTNSLKCCFPSTNADRQEKIHVCIEGSRLPHASLLHWNPPGFRKKKKNKAGYFSSRVFMCV